MEGDVVQLIMKIYANLGTYLQNEPLQLLDAVLDSADRPILVLDNDEELSQTPGFLIPLEDKNSYEIGFLWYLFLIGIVIKFFVRSHR